MDAFAPHPSLGIFARLWLAISLPWRLLFDGHVAARVQRLLPGAPDVPAEPAAPRLDPPVAAAPAAPAVVVDEEALRIAGARHVLALLQREGRLIDFLQEDVASFADAEVGAAARVIHAGCKRALAELLVVKPLRSEGEGSAVELPPGFDKHAVRLLGRVEGAPPYRGTLVHAGWRIERLHLPTRTDEDPTVLAPAEVELA